MSTVSSGFCRASSVLPCSQTPAAIPSSVTIAGSLLWWSSCQIQTPNLPTSQRNNIHATLDACRIYDCWTLFRRFLFSNRLAKEKIVTVGKMCWMANYKASRKMIYLANSKGLHRSLCKSLHTAPWGWEVDVLPQFLCSDFWVASWLVILQSKPINCRC